MSSERLNAITAGSEPILSLTSSLGK